MTLISISFKSRATTLMVSAAAAVLVFSIVLYPERAFNASLQGLTIWWNIVFPALLPFLIVTEIMFAYGLANAMGVLMEPFMRLLFNVPGIGGLAAAIGLTAGYPAGASVVCRLRKEGQLDRNEAELMLTLSHLCSPILITGVIAIGFLQQPNIGIIIAVVHYSSALASTLCMRLFLNRPRTPILTVAARIQSSVNTRWIGYRCLISMREARERDGRTFGKLLGDAVPASIQSLMIIGGLMMIFSVMIQTFEFVQISHLVQYSLSFFLPEQLTHPLLVGIFELHLGTYSISKTITPAAIQIAAITAVLSWSGLCMHAQIKSIIHSTDLRYAIFCLSRVIHGAFAFCFTIWLWRPLNTLFGNVQASYVTLGKEHLSATSYVYNQWQFWERFYPFLLVVAVMIFSSVIIAIFRKKATAPDRIY